jgi:hypothetical protein
MVISYKKTAVCLGIFFAVVGMIAIYKKVVVKNIPGSPSTASANELKLQTSYEAEVRPILAEFKKQYNSSEKSKVGAAASQARENLLKVTVPASYKDLHIDLVIVLGKFNNQAVEAIAAEYNEVIDRNSWLASEKLP